MSEEKIPVTIKALSLRKLTIPFLPTQKVDDILEELQNKEGIHRDMIRLVFSGKQINKDSTIAQLNYTPGQSIMMMLHLQGGN